MRKDIERAKSIMENAGYSVKLKESKDSEYQIMKKNYPHSKDFKDKYKESANLKDFLESLDHQGKTYEIYDNREDNGCTVFYESVETEKTEEMNEALSVGDETTYEGRPCVVSFIDPEDNEALLKFTDGETPKKMLVNLDDVESGNAAEDPETSEPETPEEPEEDYKAKYAGVLEKVNDSDSIVDQLQTLFDELVPASGPADTVAGELVRAMMRLLYRDYNDGDKFFEGYGLETCAPSAAYLGYEWDTNEIWRKLESIAESVPNMPEDQGDARYTQALEDIAEMVIDRVMKGEDFVKNTKDSRDEDISEIKEMEPLYDFEIEIPWEVQKHIEAGNISRQSLRDELETWELLRDADIDVANDYLTVTDIDKEIFGELEDTMFRDLEAYGRELDDEYGDPEEYEEDEDED